MPHGLGVRVPPCAYKFKIPGESSGFLIYAGNTQTAFRLFYVLVLKTLKHAEYTTPDIGLLIIGSNDKDNFSCFSMKNCGTY